MDASESTGTTRQITIGQLAALAWTNTRIDDFMQRPVPKDYRLTKQTRLATRALDNLFGLWLQVLVPSEPGHRDAQAIFLALANGKPELVAQVRVMFLTVLVAHFDCLLRPFLSAEWSKEAGTPKALVSKNFMEKMASREMYEQEDEFKPCRHVSVLFLGVLSISHMYSFIRAAPIAHSIGRFETLLHEALRDFVEVATRFPPEPFRPFISQLQRCVVRVISQVYADDGSDPPDLSSGPFSAILLHELTALAKRSPGVLKRYGAKSVEKRFEQQLALIVQSFGFIVVSTQVGHGTVDLVCISTDPTEPFTFLVEAKSTTKAYALPTKDSRALKDYISDVRRTLTALPPLSFVLVVSHAPSNTLGAKLGALEAQTGIPVRFMGAKQVADLREAIVGPFPLRMFRESVLTSDRILPHDLVAQLAKRTSLEKKAYRDLAEGLFQAKGVVRGH